MDENMKKYWLERYKEDKIGTIAKLSQAMQHMAWLREWQRVHGDEPRIKPITQKVNGEKVKIGESDIAVPWSQLHEFFRTGNEYGDIETVKFLIERIESGDVSQLTDTEIHNLSERENVKWSDGKHSLNPFQGYLYDFTAKNAFFLETPLGEEDYGKFYPIYEYRWANESWQGPSDLMPNDSEHADRMNQAHAAFQRYYTTRLMQQLLSSKKDSQYYDFVDFDITSVTTPEQIAELDKKLVKIVQSPEMQAELEGLEGNAEFEKAFYDKLRQEVAIEIKKDSDRIENAHKVFVALETGNLDEILEDPETVKWAREVYEAELAKEMADLEERVSNPNGSGKSREELAMEILRSQNPGLDEVFWVQTVENDLKNEEKCPYLNNPISKREILLSKLIGKPYPTYFLDGVRNDAHDSYRNEIRKPLDTELDDVDLYKKAIETRKVESNKEDVSLDKRGKVKFGYDRSGDRIQGEIEVSIKDLLKAGLDPDKMGWPERKIDKKGKVSSKSMIEAEQSLEKGLTTREVGGIKGFFNKLLDKIKNFGKGEK